MNITLNQLNIFTHVYEQMSITKASELLNMTQPAVSIQMKKLQEQFDVEFYQIVGKQIYFTDFGNAFYKEAKEILGRIEDVHYQMNSFKGVLSGKLKVSAVSTGKYILPFYLNHFMQKHDQIDLSFDASNRRKVIEDLKNNVIDIALVSVNPSEIEIDEIELMKNPLKMICSAKQKISSVQDKPFDKIPFIYREEGSATRMIMQRYVEHNELNGHIKLELSSNEAVKQAVLANIGTSILPIISLKNELKNKEVKILNDTNIPQNSKWKFIWLKNKKLSPVAEAFITSIQESKEEVYQKNFSWIEAYL